MIEPGRETTMEKLELLSRTALLKQGIDRTNKDVSEKNKGTGGDCENVVVIDNRNRLMAGVPIVSQSQYLLSAAAGAATAAIHRSTIGEKQNNKSLSTFNNDTTTMIGSNLPSLVSTDIEDEDETTTPSIASTKTRHNLHNAKARIIESRSPVTTVEYGQFVAAPPTSPYPSSPQSYGFGLVPSHNHFLQQNHSQDQQDYPPSQYNNSNGNIIRILSEPSFAPLYSNNFIPPNSHNAVAVATNNSESDAAFQPPQREVQPPRLQLQQRRQSFPSREDMARQIKDLREQLSEKDIVVSSLQHRVNHLENQINELRQLPTGKISHIPVDDMIRIMQEYGSEVSNQTLPKQRKQSIKKASIVRQFRRWNPNFFRFFLHHNGQWVPKLGQEGEFRRRTEKRRLLLIAKQCASVIANEAK